MQMIVVRVSVCVSPLPLPGENPAFFSCSLRLSVDLDRAGVDRHGEKNGLVAARENSGLAGRGARRERENKF